MTLLSDEEVGLSPAPPLLSDQDVGIQSEKEPQFPFDELPVQPKSIDALFGGHQARIDAKIERIEAAEEQKKMRRDFTIKQSLGKIPYDPEQKFGDGPSDFLFSMDIARSGDLPDKQRKFQEL